MSVLVEVVIILAAAIAALHLCPTHLPATIALAAGLVALVALTNQSLISDLLT